MRCSCSSLRVAALVVVAMEAVLPVVDVPGPHGRDVHEPGTVPASCTSRRDRVVESGSRDGADTLAAVMKAVVEPLEGNKVKVSVEVDEPEFERALDTAFKKI